MNVRLEKPAESFERAAKAGEISKLAPEDAEPVNPVLILILVIAGLLAVSFIRRRPQLLRHPAVRSLVIGAVTLGLMYLSTRFHWSVLFFGLAPLLPRLWGGLQPGSRRPGADPGLALHRRGGVASHDDRP